MHQLNPLVHHNLFGAGIRSSNCDGSAHHRPQMQRENFAILTVEHREDRSTTYDHTVGPCTECGSTGWLSSKRDELLCHSCYYGPNAEKDPIVDDIRRHLQSAWNKAFNRAEEYDLQELTLGDLEDEVTAVVCPHCVYEREAIKRHHFGIWACEECITAEQESTAGQGCTAGQEGQVNG